MRTVASATVTFITLVCGCTAPSSATPAVERALPTPPDAVGGAAGELPAGVQSPQESCACVTLTDAIASAEGALRGEAVAAKPDDDGPCMREVMVLVGDELWEAEVDGAGVVTETERADHDDNDHDDHDDDDHDDDSDSDD